MVGDGLQAAISALVALHNFQQNSHHMHLSNLTDQPLIAQLGKDVFRYRQNTWWNCMFQYFHLGLTPEAHFGNLAVWFTKEIVVTNITILTIDCCSFWLLIPYRGFIFARAWSQLSGSQYLECCVTQWYFFTLYLFSKTSILSVLWGVRHVFYVYQKFVSELLKHVHFLTNCRIQIW
jgi:hypothetical protein